MQQEIINFRNERLRDVRLISLTSNVDVNEFYAGYLLDNNDFFKYIQNKDITKSKVFLKKILRQKIEDMRNSKFKNDGVIMPFLSFKYLTELYDIDLLYLYSNSDLENSKFGSDSIFVGFNYLFIVEYKSHMNKKDEEGISDTTIKAIESLFNKKSYDLSTLEFCRENLNTINSVDKVKIENLIDYYEDYRRDPENLLKNDNLNFNICIISPVGEFNKDTLKSYIMKKYFGCKNCKECKQFNCAKFKKIKLNDIIHIQLSTEFNLEKLYNCLINKLGL